MFRTRLLSGIVLVIVALALIITGGNVLLTGLYIVSLIGLFELYRVIHIEKSLLGISGYLAVSVYYLNLGVLFLPEIEMFVLGFFILIMAVYVLQFPKYKAEQVFAGFAGVFYVAVMLSCIYQTRVMADGAYIVWLIFLCSWGSDTCAYCVGVLFGKHKMAPKLSPKKSIEGISGIGAIMSMIGDLAASAIKRNYDMKDYGKLIPGHGGILDRFDSVIFTAPIVYFLAKLFLVVA